jgi:alginate O-acetyltransferase complex protein AlgI
MIFNSLIFLVFFILFFIFYWFIFNKNLKLQNFLILVASYIFYAWSDWRLLSYLIGVSVFNFILGIHIENTTNSKHKRWLLYIGLIQGIGGLVFFKYFNFFITSFNDAFQSFGINLNLHTLNIIIPLGISFFTFRTISYLLDIDKRKIKASKDWVAFFTYVSFFPSLLSGPIDKARAFIPQLEKKRIFDYSQAVDGLRQIVWGLFKKVVIADNAAIITSQIFDNYQLLPASSLLIGAFLYVIQFYADFSGYSDMAIGFARLIGFNITKNFDFPLFAQNIAEFWRKWHISLTSWLTEYVFTPLTITFRDFDKLGLIFSILINFTIIGIWHGPNWTYVLFGFLNGCFYIPLILRGTLNKKKNTAKFKLFPTFKELINMLGTFTFVMLTFILFRSDSIIQAYHYYKHLFSLSVFSVPPIGISSAFIPCVFILIEWLQRKKEHSLQIDNIKYPVFRWSIYILLLLVFVIKYGTSASNHFIYFKF